VITVRRSTSLAVLSLLALAPAAALASGGAAASPPSVPEITTGQDPTGTSFMITGKGWTPNTLVNLEVCGNEALGGSADCDVANSQVVGVNASGEFVGFLPIAPPPSPCPCVVRAMSQTYTQIATAPIAVPGVITQPPGDRDVGTPVLRQLSIDAVSLTGSGPWTAWFGGSPERTLKLTVINTGDVPVDEAMVNLWVGGGDDPSGFIPPIRVDRLEPGESATYQVEIELGALTFGERTVAGEIRGIGEPTTFSTTTSSYPWLLIIIPIVVIVQLILVASRNRLRRRLHATEAAAAATAATAATAEPPTDEAEPTAAEEPLADEEPPVEDELAAAEEEPAAEGEASGEQPAADDAEPELAEAAQVSQSPVPPPPAFTPPSGSPHIPPPPPVRVPVAPPPPPPPVSGGSVRPAPPPLPSRAKPLEPVGATAHVFSRLRRN
jgi:hypothetical protein